MRLFLIALLSFSTFSAFSQNAGTKYLPILQDGDSVYHCVFCPYMPMSLDEIRYDSCIAYNRKIPKFFDYSERMHRNEYSVKKCNLVLEKLVYINDSTGKYDLDMTECLLGSHDEIAMAYTGQAIASLENKKEGKYIVLTFENGVKVATKIFDWMDFEVFLDEESRKGNDLRGSLLRNNWLNW